jgi:lipoate-protein ligase A
VFLLENSIKYKVPGGKLLIVKAAWDGRFTKVEILGDFFIYPEEALGGIEALLVGTRIDTDTAMLSARIRRFVEKNNVTLVGLDPDAIATGVMMVINK